MKKLIKIIPVGVPSLLALLLLLYASLAPDPTNGVNIVVFPGADKLIHILMYFLCTVLWIIDASKKRMPHHMRTEPMLAITAGAAVLGLALEVAQKMMGLGRTFEVLDIVMNAMGAVAGFLAVKFFIMHWFRHYIMSEYVRHKHHRRRTGGDCKTYNSFSHKDSKNSGDERNSDDD